MILVYCTYNNNYSRNATADKYQLSREIYCIPLTPITSYFHTQERLPFMNGSLTDDDTMLRLIADGHGRLFLGHPASLLLPDRPFPSAAADVWVCEGCERVPVRRRRAKGRVGRFRLAGKDYL